MCQDSFCSGSSPAGESPSGEGPGHFFGGLCAPALTEAGWTVPLAPVLCLSFPGSAIKTVVQSPGPGETLLAGEWETVQLQGSWKIGQTAGGSRNFASYSSNPCFPLTVPEGSGPRCVRITLHQHCLDSNCHPIGFHVFQASFENSWGSGGTVSQAGVGRDVEPWT